MDVSEFTHIPFGLPAWPPPPPGHAVNVDLVNPAPRVTRAAAVVALMAAGFGASALALPDAAFLWLPTVALVGCAALLLIIALRYRAHEQFRLVLDDEGVSAPHANLVSAGVRRVPWSEVASTELLLVNQDLVGRITARGGQTLRVSQQQLPTGWDVRDLMFSVETRALLARQGALNPVHAAAAEALVLSGRHHGAVWVVDTPDGPLVEAIVDPAGGEVLLRGQSLDPARGELVVPMTSPPPPDAPPRAP